MPTDNQSKKLINALCALPEVSKLLSENSLGNVDSSPVSQKKLESLLCSAFGYEVDVAFKGKMSLPVVEQMAYDKNDRPLLVFTPYVSPIFADRLCKKNIFFVDETGNAFLQWPGNYLFISRDIPQKERPGFKSKKGDKDFTTNTLKLIYAFLTDEAEEANTLLNQTYRQMSAASGVSVGAIGDRIESLMTQGFIEERESGKRYLVHRAKLIERWVEDYGRKLRPKLIIEHYRLPQPGWAGKLLHTDGPGLWGGEVAGARLTKHLVPETVTIYAESLPSEFIVEHDLRKDTEGWVEVLCPFWPTNENQPRQGCVHPLIVYADLMSTEIDRNLETAERIYEKHLRSLATAD